MKAYLNGGHYCIYLQESLLQEGGEFTNLTGTPLEASLQNGEDGSDFKKKVTLSYNPNAKENAVDFIPPEAYFDEIREINIVINQEQYRNLEMSRRSIFRFGGSFSVDLYLGTDLESLM